MSSSEKPKQPPHTKRQRFNQRPGRQAIVRIPVDGLPAPVEVVIVRVDQRTGTVELEIPVEATIGHRLEAKTRSPRADKKTSSD